jgi:hypothetical protein
LHGDRTSTGCAARRDALADRASLHYDEGWRYS